jgi:hypothetical protein
VIENPCDNRAREWPDRDFNPIPECRAEPVNRDLRVEASAELMQAAVRQPQAALGLEYRIALVGFLFASDIIQEGDGGAAERHNVFPLPFGVRCGNPPNIADLAVIVEHLRPGGLASLTTAAAVRMMNAKRNASTRASCMVCFSTARRY